MGKKVLLEFLSHKKDRHGYRNTRKQAKLINLGTKINNLWSYSTPILILGSFYSQSLLHEYLKFVYPCREFDTPSKRPRTLSLLRTIVLVQNISFNSIILFFGINLTSDYFNFLWHFWAPS